MALVDTSRAIGAVTRALKERLTHIVGKNVTVGRPDQSTGAEAFLNLFLYEVTFDPHLKNTALNDGEKPPIWVVLKYLLTAFETTDVSDSPAAHDLLGSAIRAVYRDDLLSLNGLSLADDIKALAPNPSELHLTFDESSVDLLAKLMQGSDEKLRLSFCFEVRPVMIASAEPGQYSLLVGVDYTQPPVTLTPKPVRLDIIPSFGPVISEVSPAGFEENEIVTVRGTDLHLSNLTIKLGPVEFPVTKQAPDELEFRVDQTPLAAANISAGSHPVAAVVTLPGTGKKRSGNTIIANLVPTLSEASIAAGTLTVVAGTPRKFFATIDLRGRLLGKTDDDTVLAFYRDGKVSAMFDVLGAPSADQTTRQFVMSENDALEEGDYLMILLVNGQQAPQSPVVPLKVGP